MSMIGNFLLVSDGDIERALARPDSVHDLIDADAPADQRVDVDKAWHCLHFLLTGTAWEGEWPLNFIVLGGTEVGEEDVGYGPARAVRARELVEIARALAAIDVPDLRARFRAEEMDEQEIYPSGPPGTWSDVDPTRDEEFGYFTGAFEAVKALVNRGVDRRLGMLIWLS